LTKFMCRLIETIKINNGTAENIFWHNSRFYKSRNELFGIKENINLEEVIHIPGEFSKAEVKCRLTYGKSIELIEFEPYFYRPVNSLKLFFDDSIQYDYKYKDRSQINMLYQQKGDNDDIIIVKNGMVSDSSYCNLVFSNGNDFITPSTPLLMGIKRAKYLSEGRIKERKIRIENLKEFNEVHLINAFLDLGRCVVKIENIS